MSTAFVFLWKMVFFKTEAAVDLLVCSGVGGRGLTILINIWRKGNIRLAVTKKPASSASRADDMTNFMISEMVSTAR